MKLEKQICNLELAKKLKELGLKQNSLWYWISIGILNNKHVGWRLELSHNCNCEEPLIAQEYYSAYTVAELGELLPFKIYSCTLPNPFELKINKLENKWEVYYLAYESSELNNTDLCPTISAETEADALAKMLIYLLENKLLDNNKLKED